MKDDLSSHYTRYERFREAFLNRKGIFGYPKFVDSVDNTFWTAVYEKTEELIAKSYETDPCVKDI